MKILYWLPFLFVCFPLFAEDYMRVAEGPAGSKELQIAVRRFQIQKPVEREIVLVGVTHIGTAGYYRKLQTLLDDSGIVLYEGVDGDREAFRQMKKEEHELGENSTLQVSLAHALGLTFQLHQIDYNQPHFVNSDVTSQELFRLFRGEDIVDADAARKDTEQLMRNMQAMSAAGQLMVAMLGQLERNPSWSRAMRWCMVQTLGNIRGDISQMAGLPPRLKDMMTVLIQKRNEVVMEDLEETLRDPEKKGSIALFYGAAHMADFEERIVKEMGGKELGTEWLTAFRGSLKTSGLNLLEKSMVRGFLNQQLNVLKVMQDSIDQGSSEATP